MERSNQVVRILKLATAGILLAPALATAGGGGQNMLLIVNPNDESALRMANAYVKARAIPEKNILYIATPTGVGYKLNTIAPSVYTSTYRDAIGNAITQRGLGGQVDYIGTIGAPMVVGGSARDANNVNQSVKLSFNYFVSMNAQFQRGLTYPAADYRASELFKTNVPYTPAGGSGAALPYTRNTNAAIHSSTEYTIPAGVVAPPGYTTAKWYMSGNVGYAGTHAITADQYIASYNRSAQADGTKPNGKVYFIENDGVRSETREYYWKSVQNYMTANGMAWEQVRQLYDGTPKNAPDVRGAVVGAATYNVPNGSTYLPGSWLDSLTSNGGGYNTSAQVKADKFIGAGAAGTAGTVSEPYAIADRFTQSTQFIFHGEGSTLGESFFMSVKRPDLLMFQGDLLSQAYADVATVSLTTGPANGATVSGNVNLGAAATLTNPAIATGIARLKLYVDGVDKGEIAGATGAFNLDTTTLSDGRHEVRVVAINNAAAESQGYLLQDIVVNNKGQSVAIAGGSLNAAWNQTLQVPVGALAGNGAATVQRVELRSIGRSVGQVVGAAGNVALNAQLLAYGENEIIPVAIMSDGSEVRGAPVVVNRQFNKVAGMTPTDAGLRTPGLQFEYFTNSAGRTIAQSNFAAAPNHTIQASRLVIEPSNETPSLRNMPDEYLSDNNLNLGIRVSSRFNIATEGEYGFFFDTFNANFDSLSLRIDGQEIMAHEFWNGSTFNGASMVQGADTLRNIYLLPGEHTFSLLLGNPSVNTDDRLELTFWYRDPSGTTRLVDSSFFYTTVPEPAIGLAASGLFISMLGRRSRRQHLLKGSL